MADADFILKLEIVEDRSPDAAHIAEALSAWVDVIKTAGLIIEPSSGVRVELVGVEPGSQLFKLAIKRIEETGQQVLAGASEFPLVSKVVMTLASLVASSFLIVGVEKLVTPDPRIPADQMDVFKQMETKLSESVELQKQSMRFYGILQDEPAIDRVDVLRAKDKSLLYGVPRSEFAVRSGLWTGDPGEESSKIEIRTAVWDVVLIKPALIAKPRRWTFARDGLEFSALMEDGRVLEAIQNKTLPIQIAEGVMMRIEVQYKEEFDGKAWVPNAASRRVRRVLHPLPPLPSIPLFSTSSLPKKDD